MRETCRPLSAQISRPLTYVAKYPGQSVEQIGKALGHKTKELALPIIRMIEAKKLRTTGERRGTRYFAK